MDEVGRKRRLNESMGQLGFIAAEICSLQAVLARACAEHNTELVKDLADDLIARHAHFHESYTQLLLATISTRGLSERMSV